MRNLFRTSQILLIVLFIAIAIASSYSTTAVNILGITGIVVSLAHLFLYRKLKRDSTHG